jgi:hypothetical protein
LKLLEVNMRVDTSYSKHLHSSPAGSEHTSRCYKSASRVDRSQTLIQRYRSGRYSRDLFSLDSDPDV